MRGQRCRSLKHRGRLGGRKRHLERAEGTGERRYGSLDGERVAAFWTSAGSKRNAGFATTADDSELEIHPEFKSLSEAFGGVPKEQVFHSRLYPPNLRPKASRR